MRTMTQPGNQQGMGITMSVRILRLDMVWFYLMLVDALRYDADDIRVPMSFFRLGIPVSPMNSICLPLRNVMVLPFRVFIAYGNRQQKGGLDPCILDIQ